MRNYLSRTLCRERGATTAGSALLLAFIALSSVAGLSQTGDGAKTTIGTVSQAFGGGSATTTGAIEGVCLDTEGKDCKDEEEVQSGSLGDDSEVVASERPGYGTTSHNSSVSTL